MLDQRWHTAPLCTARLQSSVAEAYRVFRNYRLDAPLIVCMCNSCVSDNDARALLTTSLEAISSTLLAEYTNSAHGYDFEKIEAQFKYFLPRYLELIALDEPPHHFASELTLIRLNDAHYRECWNKEEVETINEFFRSLIDAFLTQLPFSYQFRVLSDSSFDFHGAVDMIIYARGDMEGTLAVWEAHPDPIAALHVASARASRVKHDGDGWVYNQTFQVSSLDGYFRTTSRRFGEWLQSDSWTKRIEAAFFLTDCPSEQAILSQAVG